LNDFDKWRALYGRKSRRLKDMELILRFFALLYYAGEYQSPMKDFLNRYMATNRRLERQSEEELKAIFGQTTTILSEAIGQRAFRPRTAVNAAVVDSLMTGVATRLAQGPIRDRQQFKQQYDSLIKNMEYTGAVESGTSQEANVATRLKLAKQAFATVK
jgi:hypothetical protein